MNVFESSAGKQKRWLAHPLFQDLRVPILSRSARKCRRVAVPQLGGGDWGNAGWNGGWNGGGQGGGELQPEMTAALQHLREAQRNLQLATHDKGGHRENAIRLIDQALGGS